MSGAAGYIFTSAMYNRFKEDEKHRQSFNEFKRKYIDNYYKEHKIKDEAEAKRMLNFINEVTGANRNVAEGKLKNVKDK